MESNQTSNLANSSNMGPLPQVSGFTLSSILRRQMICTARPFFTNVSLVAFQFAFHKNFSPNSKIIPALPPRLGLEKAIKRSPDNSQIDRGSARVE